VATNRGHFLLPRIDFLDGLSLALTHNMRDAAAYVNYVDSEYSKEAARSMYYGDKLYAELKRIKSEVDPDNVFANPQSIDP
jgi:FAD/FMN-containing dehydrogenase